MASEVVNSVVMEILFWSISKESQIHQRISELRKEGQWSASRLPKLVESSRPKSQWDYLLEEMQWMAADFAQERRWKEAAAKKVRAEVSQKGVEGVTQRSVGQPPPTGVRLEVSLAKTETLQLFSFTIMCSETSLLTNV